MRAQRGCHGDATVPLWAGTEDEMTTCPRRIVLGDPLLTAAMTAYSHSDDGRLGAALLSLPNRLVEAADALGRGVSRRRREREELERARERMRR
jgi:hypothetical protein